MRQLLAIFLLATSASTQAQGTIIVDANQAMVGYAVDSLTGSLTGVASSKGYTFAVDMLTGVISSDRFTIAGGITSTLSSLYFTTADCSGQAYFIGPPVAGGFLLRHGTGQVYYAEKGEMPQVRAIPARKVSPGASCEAWGGTASSVRALQNDPAVTGLATGEFAAPLELSFFQVWNTLFRDGFESQS